MSSTMGKYGSNLLGIFKNIILNNDIQLNFHFTHSYAVAAHFYFTNFGFHINFESKLASNKLN